MDTAATDTIAKAIEAALPLLIAYGLKVAGAIAVLLVGRLVAGALRNGLRRRLASRDVDPSLIPFVSNLVYWFALAVVIIAVLGLFGIQTTSLVAVLGAAGLAVGLALQGTLSNFSAGVMLLMFRPFKVGDYVECAGTAGAVKEIGVFSTLLTTPDNVAVIVPNAEIFGTVIKNYHAYDTRRNDLVVGISYDDDIARAVSVIEGVLAADDRVLKDPAPVVAVAELADSSVNLVVRPWCSAADYWALRFDLTRRLKEALEEAGCSIPYPQHDVHLQPQAPPAA